MPVDNNINDTTINMTASIPTRKADMQKKDVLATDDGSCTYSNGSSTSEDEEDPDYEGVSTHKVSEVSTGALCLSGSPSNFHMENNSDVQIGPRLHYNAPVTINQFVHVLGNNEVSPDGILQEAVRAPIHGLDAEESNKSQGTFSSCYTSNDRTSRTEFVTRGCTNLAKKRGYSFSSYLSRFSYYCCINEDSVMDGRDEKCLHNFGYKA